MKYLMPLMLILLCSCSTTSYYQSTRYMPYQGYSYDEYEGYYGPSGEYYGQDSNQQSYGGGGSNQVRVPNSYYAGGYRSPESPQSRDSRWVARQNPSGYTIEISRGGKASHVAKDLLQAPKNNRTAALRSGGGYVGVYGSYSNYDQAKQAYDSLPDNLRQNARIKSWGSVR